MADFKKVRTGHERWMVQRPAVSVHAYMLADFGTGAGAWGRGPLPSMRDRLKRFCSPESSLVAPLPGRSLAG